jgi:SAM-dependent methyltransferase
MRDYKNVDKHITALIGDIYPQPPDEGHKALANKTIDRWMSSLTGNLSILDVGAGQGFCQPMFERWGVKYTGVALGEDVVAAQKAGYNVKKMDFNFLEYEDDSFDMIFSRHSLEHSWSPLISLMEWYRVSRSWLGIVVPAPEHFTYAGRNHYYVFNRPQYDNLLQQAGWNMIWEHTESNERGIAMEYQLFCEKKKRPTYEYKNRCPV